MPERKAARSLRPVPDSGRAPGRVPEPVRLVREWKGPTVADVLRDESLAVALPGRAVRALGAIARGDLAAADAALPGDFERVLVGPWRRRRRWRHVLLLLVALVLVACLLLAMVAA